MNRNLPGCWRKIGLLAAGALAAALTPSCLVDLNNRCGPNQRFDGDNARCVCEQRYALDGTSCVACPEHEVGSDNACVCEPGYYRTADDQPCMPQSAALGASCQADADCVDPSYAHCQLSAGDGYCTNANCVADTDCTGDYSCNSYASPSFCEKPPSGLGTTCSASAQCAGFEASYCETVEAHSCVVNDCKPDPSRCYGSWVCCDIGLLGQSLCIPPDQLDNGACPAGGTLIPRSVQ